MPPPPRRRFHHGSGESGIESSPERNGILEGSDGEGVGTTQVREELRRLHRSMPVAVGLDDKYNRAPLTDGGGLGSGIIFLMGQ